MGYPKNHIEDDCDRCLKRVGKKNLLKVPYLYLDYNDRTHNSLKGNYKQYYVCGNCYLLDVKK